MLKRKIDIYLYFLNPISWLKIYFKRKRIKGLRKKTDREVIGKFEGKILFQEIENPILKYIVNPVFNLYWQLVKKLVIW